MPPPDERTALRLVARGFIAMVVVLVGIPSYLTLAPSWRPLAARLACALLVAFFCVRIVRSVRGSMAGATPSALEAMPPRAQRGHHGDHAEGPRQERGSTDRCVRRRADRGDRALAQGEQLGQRNDAPPDQIGDEQEVGE